MPIKRTPIIDINPTQFKKSFSSHKKSRKREEVPVCPECGKDIYTKYGHVQYQERVDEYGVFTKEEDYDVSGTSPTGEIEYSCPNCGRILSLQEVYELLHI